MKVPNIGKTSYSNKITKNVIKTPKGGLKLTIESKPVKLTTDVQSMIRQLSRIAGKDKKGRINIRRFNKAASVIKKTLMKTPDPNTKALLNTVDKAIRNITAMGIFNKASNAGVQAYATGLNSKLQSNKDSNDYIDNQTGSDNKTYGA